MSRYYEIQEKQYPSVTTILSVISKPALVNWAAKVEREWVIEVSGNLYEALPEKKMSKIGWTSSLQSWIGKAKAADKLLQKAGEIGSQAHALIEWTLKGELCFKVGPSPEVSPEATWAFSQWQKWRSDVNLKPLAVEQTVWSDKYGYAGTMDLLAEIDGHLAVVDWKSGKAIYPEAWLQNAAYREAVKEMGHGDPEVGVIVRLPKVKTDPEFEAVRMTESNGLFDTFLHAKSLWEWQNKVKKKWGEDEVVRGPKETL